MINNNGGLNQTQLDILSELEYLSGKVSEENVSLTKTGTGGYLTLFFDYLKERFELHQIDLIGEEENEVTKDVFKRKIARFELRSFQEVGNVLDNYSLEELAQLPLNKMILKLKGGEDLSDEKENGLWEKIFTLPFSPLKLKDTWEVSTFKTFNLPSLIWYRQVSEVVPETEWQKIIVENMLQKKNELKNKVDIVQETDLKKITELFESLFEICGGQIEGVEFLRNFIFLKFFKCLHFTLNISQYRVCCSSTDTMFFHKILSELFIFSYISSSIFILKSMKCYSL